MSAVLRLSAAVAIGVACGLVAHAVAGDVPRPPTPTTKSDPRPAVGPASADATDLARRIDGLEAALARVEFDLSAPRRPVVSAPPPARDAAGSRDEAVRLTRIERDFPRALQAWQELVRRDPSSPDATEAWASIGDLQRRLGDAAAAEAAFRKAMEGAAPGSAPRRRAALEAAKLAGKRGAHDEAARLAADVAAEEGVDAETWGAAKCVVASSASSMGDAARARAEWEAVVAAARDDARLSTAAVKARRGLDWLARNR